MNRHVVLSVAIILTLVCAGCSGNAINVTSNKDQVDISSIGMIIDSFKRIENIGNDLFLSFDDYTDMSVSSKYEAVKQAEKYTKKMEVEYDDIIDNCQVNDELQNVSYQVQLMKNLIPQPADNTEQALNNAAVLYKLYFQQISSSFSIIASNIDDIEKEQDVSYSVGYYDELKNMPMPDTIIMGIEFSSKVKEDGIIKYTYISDKDNTNAQLNYNLFLIAVGMDTGLSLTFDGTAAYVYKENTMVSAIMAGNDDELGNFFMVSFPE